MKKIFISTTLLTALSTFVFGQNISEKEARNILERSFGY